MEQLVTDLQEALKGELEAPLACSSVSELLRRYCQGPLDLPERVQQSRPDCYARHLVHQAPAGFSMVLMVWLPGQATALHDHGGCWCVEACLLGRLRISSFRLQEETTAGEFRFAAQDSLEVGPGAVGHLIPPYEYHRVENSGSERALSLHVYARELDQCRRYRPLGDQWYRVEEVPLSYCSLPAPLDTNSRKSCPPEPQ